MGCFDDYMQFRDEVEAAKKRLDVMGKARDAGTERIESETKMPPERQIPQLKVSLPALKLQD
jgi:hypothetical protein